MAKDHGWRICAAGVLLAALTACGGGGGGGDGAGGGSAPLQYSGNSSAASLSTSNAAAISANAIGAGSGIAGTISGISGTSADAAGDGQVDIGRRLVRTVRATVPAAGAAPRLTAEPVSATEACPGGGSVSVAGDVSPGGTGTVTITFSGCALEGVVFTGQGTLRIDSFNVSSRIPLDLTLSFGRLSLRGAVNADVGGSLRVQTDLGANAETITENLVALNISTGRMTKSENLVFRDVYNDIFSPASYTESINGRVYDSVHGFVDIITNAALVFPSLTQPFPSSGELLLTGAAGRRVRITANSATVAVLALDLDGNGTFEREVRLSWSGLSGTAGADLVDSDGDGMHNSWETAFGLDPNVDDAAGDLDMDGFNNLAEYNGGTDPSK